MANSTNPKSSTNANGKSNCHAGHRQRMRERFQREGLSGFADHEIVEMLLYPMIPRINTNPLAHRLMETFGSIENLLRRAVEDKPKSFSEQAYMAELETAILSEMNHIPRPDPLTQSQIYVLAIFYLRRYTDHILCIRCTDTGVLEDVILLPPTEEALLEQLQNTTGLCHFAAVQGMFSLKPLRDTIGSERTKLLELTKNWSAVWA